VLKKQWSTYVNTFASTPVGVLRPLILDALVEASHDDDRVAVAFVACARNVLPFMETGNEQSIWADVVEKIEADVDHRAELLHPRPPTDRGRLGDSQAELPDSPADHRHASTEAGIGEGYSVTPAALAGRYHGQRVHAGAAGKRAADGRNGLRDAH